MKALLLGAGLGTRLRGSLGPVPKILAPLGERTLLDHQLSYLAGQGVAEVAVNLHHLADAVTAHLERTRPPVPVRLSVEPELLGTAGALLPLADFLDEPFVLLYGDVVTDLDLRALAARHTGLATLACYSSSDLAGKGVLEVDDALRVVSFVEKGADGRPEGLVNAGIHVLDPDVLRYVGDPPSDFGLDVWPAALAAGARINAAPTDTYVKDVGTPEALAEARDRLERGL